MIRLAIRAPSEAAERVLGELLELAPSGVEQVDGRGFVEYAVYGVPGELPSLPSGSARLGGVTVEVRGEEVPDDWSERWKQWHRPVDVAAGGRRVRVRPPWEAPLDGEGIDLIVDPGQAFGTGGHHTTRLCLELLLEREPAGALADWGCGSGVLALAAARLGYDPVLAVDFDPTALEATRENAEANGIAGVAVGHADLSGSPGPWADTVVANLVRPLLLDVAARLEQAPRVIIVSGLLRAEGDEIAAAFTPHGLREADRRDSGEWSALVLESR